MIRKITVLGCLLCVAAAPQAAISADLDLLGQATTEQQAGALEERILAAWHAQLTPSVQLLVEKAMDEIHAGKSRDATADFDAAIALQPDSADLWRMRAEARYAAGDDQGAVADLAQALSREPRCFPALADLSHFAEGRQDFRRALQAWQKLMEIDPKVGQGAARLQRLQHKVLGQPA